MDLDATPYRIFVTVADELSFTRASALLNVSQPALSARICEFERRLGFALFSRTSRRVELTVEGRLFLGNARRMVTESSWASQAAREIRDNDLRIGAPLYTMLIPKRRELIDRLFMEHPNIHLRIFDKSHSRNFADLTRREIDLALHVEPSDVSTAEIDAVSEADWPDGLERLHLDEKQIALQIPAEHPWSRMDAVPIEMLKDQKYCRHQSRAWGTAFGRAQPPLARGRRRTGAPSRRAPDRRRALRAIDPHSRGLVGLVRCSGGCAAQGCRDPSDQRAQSEHDALVDPHPRRAAPLCGTGLGDGEKATNQRKTRAPPSSIGTKTL